MNKEEILIKWIESINTEIDEIELKTYFSKILDNIDNDEIKKDIIKEMVDNFSKYEISPNEIANMIIKLADILDENIEMIKKVYMLAFDIYEEFNVIQKEMINKQIETIKSMDIPILRLDDDTILIPLIGFIDSQKAFDLIRKILTTIKEKNTLKVIVDIEGIPVIDTEIANQFLRLHRAIKIIGAKLIISGITPAVAETLVHLEIDLPIKTRADLKLAIEAFKNNEV